MKYTIVILLTAFTIVSCTHNRNGKYIIYKVSDKAPELGPIPYFAQNDSVANYMQTQLQGKSFDIMFTRKYVAIHPTGSKDTLYLSAETDKNGKTFYEQHLDMNLARRDYILVKSNEDQLILDCKLELLQDAPIVSPVQLGGLLRNMRAPRQARVFCYLSEVTH